MLILWEVRAELEYSVNVIVRKPYFGPVVTHLTLDLFESLIQSKERVTGYSIMEKVERNIDSDRN